MRKGFFCRCCAFLVFCLFVLVGCAAKIPKSIPLNPEQQVEAATLLTTFLAMKRPAAIDSDIHINWDILASKGAINATLQMQQPAFLRFAAVDPLGRSLVLAVSDGRSFTMVDNRIGRVYQGETETKFWRSYVPEELHVEDLYFLLGGFLPKVDPGDTASARDQEVDGFWYVWKDNRAMTHHVLLDRQSKTMHRHLLFNSRGNLVLDLTYSAYSGGVAAGMNWPGHLRVTGTAITGTLRLQVDQIYSRAPLQPSVFRLSPPPQFPVEHVQ